VLNVGLLSLVQVNFEEASSIQTDPDPLSNDLSGVDKIVQDGSVYSHQGAGPWTLLLKLVGLPGRLGQDPPLGNKYHMLARELLLKLPHQPGLNLLEGFELRHRDEDYDGFLASRAFHLYSKTHWDRAKVG